MNRLMTMVVPLLLLIVSPAFGADVERLASCTTKVLEEVSRSRTWSGKAPVGCFAKVSVQWHPDGLLVTASQLAEDQSGWLQTFFSAVATFAELEKPQALKAANKDIMARSRRLTRCLEAKQSVNAPVECRARGGRNYEVGEESGITDFQEIWLDDQGRYTVVHSSIGDTMATPTLPEEFYDYDAFAPGVEINLHRNKRVTR